MAATKLNLSMVEQAELFFGDLDFNDKFIVWRNDGRAASLVSYGRLLQLFGGPGGGPTDTNTIVPGGQVGINDATTVLIGGFIGSTRPVNRIMGRPL